MSNRKAVDMVKKFVPKTSNGELLKQTSKSLR